MEADPGAAGLVLPAAAVGAHADHVVLMDEGRVLASGSYVEVRDSAAGRELLAALQSLDRGGYHEGLAAPPSVSTMHLLQKQPGFLSTCCNAVATQGTEIREATSSASREERALNWLR